MSKQSFLLTGHLFNPQTGNLETVVDGVTISALPLCPPRSVPYNISSGTLSKPLAYTNGQSKWVNKNSGFRIKK